VVDHHVDRPGVDAQQCVKLTGPNRSIGSILFLPQGRRKHKGQPPRRPTGPVTHSGKNRARMTFNAKTSLPHTNPQPLPLFASAKSCRGARVSFAHAGRFDGLVATARGKTPDPIPNSAVKTLSANGTASQDAGE
jgi:hypothetical protein